MIFDKQTMWADDDAYDMASPAVDLGAGWPKGPGEVILVNVRGKDLTVDVGGQYYVTVTSSNDGVSYGNEMEVGMGLITALNGGLTFGLSSAVSRYVKIELTGFTAGTWTCGIVAGVYP